MKRFLFLSAIGCLFLSSCQKNETPYEIYFFTSNKNLPTLFATEKNHFVAPVLLRKTRDYVTDTSTNKLLTYDKEVRVEAVDKNGQVIATTKLKLNDDGSFVSTGGGYLHYEIKIIKERVLVIDYIRQM